MKRWERFKSWWRALKALGVDPLVSDAELLRLDEYLKASNKDVESMLARPWNFEHSYARYHHPTQREVTEESQRILERKYQPKKRTTKEKRKR